MKSGKLIKKRNTAALLFCAAAIVLNVFLGALTSALELPLYLDTVGTITAAVMGGYLPGALVGFITNIVKGISDPSYMYYGVLNVLLAICATYLAKRGWFRKIPGLFGAVGIFTLICGGIGAVIPMYLNGLSPESETISRMLLETGFFSPAVAIVISNIIMDLPDKLISVFTAAVIIKAVPERFYRYCSLSLWQQKNILPDAEKEEDKARSKLRFLSVRSKTLIVSIAALTLVAISGVIISMRVHYEDIMKQLSEFAQSTARIAADVIDGDRVDEYIEKAGKTEGYDETKEILGRVLASSDDILYLYAYQVREDGCYVVFDVDTQKDTGDEAGTKLPLDAGFLEHLPEFLNGSEIEPFTTNDEYGYLLSAYEPVFNSSGSCVCYVGTDVDLEQMAADERSFLVKMITVYSGFLILFCTFVLWLVDYHIIFPLRAITDGVDSFSFMEESQNVLDENVKAFRSIDVHTGDELESLYQSLCRMTLNQTEQMRSISRLSDSTAKMQDGLILTMADLVESRDSDTGAHVQKTAAYAKIIVEGLKKKGYYIEKITPKFMSDVVRSAPLHDIGKINIPDKVLNKPGKLTDEEYEIMKTHTTAGKRIMENAISTVKGDNYLKEARNMAAYHHERWDGKGYPEGIHGEVIPLSARIMAVADVFDALTSPRVYKPAYPLEKALVIMEEGKGTQFDPKCIEVFMDALPEVKVILRKYNKDV